MAGTANRIVSESPSAIVENGPHRQTGCLNGSDSGIDVRSRITRHKRLDRELDDRIERGAGLRNPVNLVPVLVDTAVRDAVIRNAVSLRAVSPIAI